MSLPKNQNYNTKTVKSRPTNRGTNDLITEKLTTDLNVLDNKRSYVKIKLQTQFCVFLNDSK